MSYWIFKIIWVPILASIWLAGFAVVIVMLKDCGWDVPIRWISIIGIIALIADGMMNP